MVGTYEAGVKAKGWDPSLTNVDIVPNPVERRTWNWFNFSAIWMGMTHNQIAFAIVGGLILTGYSAGQALLVIGIGTLIELALLAVTGRIGSRYGITFAVWARSAFGVYGANIPALIRGAVAIGWAGVQIYLGATVVNALLGAVFSGWKGLGSTVISGLGLNFWIAMVVFWLLHFLLIRHGMNTIRRFENWAGPMVILVMVPLTIWSVVNAGGVGPVFSSPSKFNGAGDFIVSGLFVGIALFISGSWATLILNYPDLTRFAVSNRQQTIGTFIGLPIATIVFYSMATIVVSSAQVTTGRQMWLPADILVSTGNTAFIIFGAALLVVATLSVNIAANLVSPAYDIANLFPRFFTFRRAAVAAIILAFAYNPWKLMENPNTLFSVLNNIGAFLGPATGILIADYLFVHKRRLDVDELYRVNGRYRCWRGFNIPTIAVLLVTTALCLAGEVFPSVAYLYTYAWFVGLGSSFILYLVVVEAIRRLSAAPRPEFEVSGSEGQEAIEVGHTPQAALSS